MWPMQCRAVPQQQRLVTSRVHMCGSSSTAPGRYGGEDSSPFFSHILSDLHMFWGLKLTPSVFGVVKSTCHRVENVHLTWLLWMTRIASGASCLLQAPHLHQTTQIHQIQPLTQGMSHVTKLSRVIISPFQVDERGNEAEERGEAWREWEAKDRWTPFSQGLTIRTCNEVLKSGLDPNPEMVLKKYWIGPEKVLIFQFLNSGPHYIIDYFLGNAQRLTSSFSRSSIAKRWVSRCIPWWRSWRAPRPALSPACSSPWTSPSWRRLFRSQRFDHYVASCSKGKTNAWIGWLATLHNSTCSFQAM